jgi:hypothetical protein
MITDDGFGVKAALSMLAKEATNLGGSWAQTERRGYDATWREPMPA